MDTGEIRRRYGFVYVDMDDEGEGTPVPFVLLLLYAQRVCAKGMRKGVFMPGARTRRHTCRRSYKMAS